LGGLAGAVSAIAAVVLAQGAGAATLKADYRFQDARSSSVAGAPALTDLGVGNAFATETVGGCATRVLRFPKGNGLRLRAISPGFELVDPLQYSVVMLTRLADVSAYRRLLEFENGTAENGVYVHDGKLAFYQAGPHEGPSAVVTKNAYAEIAFTNGTPSPGMGQVVGYVNGVPQFTFGTVEGRFDDELRFFQDASGGTVNEDSAGAVSRIRVYDGALTPAEVTSIYNQGPLASPGASCPAGGSATTSVTGKPKAKKGPDGTIVVHTGIEASCPDGGADCTGTGSIDRRKKSKVPKHLGRSGFTVPAGQTQEVTVTLKKKAKKALKRKKKLKVTAAATVTGPDGTPASEETVGKIKRPKKHR
jgi:hypothetical protein